jgi:peptide/nickel transport system substrate-binding protein
MASPGSGFFGGLVGAQDVIDGKAKDLSGITTGAGTITFTLAQPDGSFLKRLSMPFTCPVPKGTPSKAVEDGSLPTTGPYKVESYKPSRELVLSRNEQYDAELLGERGKADTIRFPIGIDGQQAVLKIKSGELDLFLEYLPGTDATQALNDASLKGRVFSNPAPSVMYLWMNNQVPPFDNPDVRKAVNYAIDRTQIVKVWGGPATAKPTDQILPPTTADWQDTQMYPLTPDVAKAKELMQQSGVATPVKVVLRVRNDAPGFVEMAQVAQANLKEIGIEVEIKGAPDAVNEPIITNPKTRSPMGINQWTEDYPDGDSYINTLLDPRRPEYSQNKARFGEKSLRSAFDKMAPLTGDERDQAWQDLDRQVMEFAPWAPLFNPLRVDLISNRVTNYVYQPVYGPSLTQLAVKE